MSIRRVNNRLKVFIRKALAENLKKLGHKDVQVLDDVKNLAKMVSDTAEEGDFVICLGAGNITKWAYDLPAQLDKAFAKKQKQRA